MFFRWFIRLFSRRHRAEPAPVSSGGVAVAPAAMRLMLETMAAQTEKGLATYGTYLETFNGRSPERDAIAEIADAAVYLTQSLLEREEIERSLRATHESYALLYGAVRAHVEAYHYGRPDEELATLNRLADILTHPEFHSPGPGDFGSPEGSAGG